MQRTRDSPVFLFRRRAVLLWARIVLWSMLSLSWIGNAAAAVNSVDTRQRQQLPQLSQDWSDIHDIGLAIRGRRQDNETPLGMQVHLFAFSVSLGVWMHSLALPFSFMLCLLQDPTTHFCYRTILLDLRTYQQEEIVSKRCLRTHRMTTSMQRAWEWTRLSECVRKIQRMRRLWLM